MKKLLIFLFMFTAFPLAAQMAGMGDIDAIMEDNALKDAANRYSAFMVYFFPEDTTRQGLTLGNRNLNVRTNEQLQQAIQALASIRIGTNNVNQKKLSADKKVDYDLFSRALDAHRWKLQQNELSNPLYYTQAFDAIYDLYLRTNDNPRQRNANIFVRASALANTAKEAADNVVSPSPLLAKAAMEKTYYAYLAFDEVIQSLVASTGDEFAAKEIGAQLTNDKKYIKQMFEQFKQQSQKNSFADYRLGADIYDQLLKQVYHIDENTEKLNRELTENLEDTRHLLFDALAPFEQTAEGSVTFVNGNNEPITKNVPRSSGKKKKSVYVPPTAAQFFAIAEHFETPRTENVTALLEREANEFASRLSQDYQFPALTKPVIVKPLPTYHAYMLPSLFIDADGFNVFFVRVPSGNALAKEKALAEDFNTPMRKVLISKELVPGAYYQAVQTENLANERKMFASPTLKNGWKAFALDLAQGNGYFVTDEEHLAAAWASYKSALEAIIDFQLNSRFISYNEALTFLTDDNGFTKEQAEEILREVLLNPGRAVSTEYGREKWVQVYNKYTKKFNKNFTKKDLLNLFFQTGNVPPTELENEIKRLYQNLKAK